MLNDTERLVRDCIVMRLHEKEALAYLKGEGHEISRVTYYRTKGRLEATKLKRLYDIAKIGLADQHADRIDRLEFVDQELMRCAVLEQNPYKKAKILEMIANIQPYLSAYYESTKEVLENSAKPQQEDSALPDIGATATSATK